MDEDKDVMLIARTAELARLHRTDLAGHGRLSDVRVTSLGALADERPADVALLTGMAPTWARFVYRSGIATSILVLAYTPEGPVESVARGYDEVELVRRAVSLQTAREKWLARAYAKDRDVVGIERDAASRRFGRPTNDLPTATSRNVAITTPAPRTSLRVVGEGMDGWPTWNLAVPEDVVGPDRAGLDGSGTSVVTAVKITFDDGRGP